MVDIRKGVISVLYCNPHRTVLQDDVHHIDTIAEYHYNAVQDNNVLHVPRTRCRSARWAEHKKISTEIISIDVYFLGVEREFAHQHCEENFPLYSSLRVVNLGDNAPVVYFYILFKKGVDSLACPHCEAGQRQQLALG